MTHIVLHFAVPLVVVLVFYRPRWRNAFFVLIGTMLIDLDHLLADPIYDLERCSIGFHPGHTWPAIFFYALVFGWSLWQKQSRRSDGSDDREAGRWGGKIYWLHLISLGLLIHMALDGLDCLG